MGKEEAPVGLVNLHGKRILITQASAFMGLALCEIFAAAGADVVADDADLRDPNAPATLVAATGHIDVLVANLTLPAPATRSWHTFRPWVSKWRRRLLRRPGVPRVRWLGRSLGKLCTGLQVTRCVRSIRCLSPSLERQTRAL